MGSSMTVFSVRINELQTDRIGQSALLLECTADRLPAPGQYLHALPADPGMPLPSVLFPSRILQPGPDDSSARFLAAPHPAFPCQPGMPLTLRGPLGNGFTLPPLVKRLALIAYHAPISPLLPLMDRVLAKGGEVSISCDECPDGLPEAVEISPFDDLRAIFSWADFAAITTSMEQQAEMDQHMIGKMRSIPAQVLVRSPMPCGGLADCGLCAVPAKRGYKLACKDGPVFDWHEIGG